MENSSEDLTEMGYKRNFMDFGFQFHLVDGEGSRICQINMHLWSLYLWLSEHPVLLGTDTSPYPFLPALSDLETLCVYFWDKEFVSIKVGEWEWWEKKGGKEIELFFLVKKMYHRK